MFLRLDLAMDGLNHYAYANCNPIRYNDPTGLSGTPIDWQIRRWENRFAMMMMQYNMQNGMSFSQAWSAWGD